MIRVKTFWLALSAVAIATLPSTGYAASYPAAQCNISYAFLSHCPEVSRWCEATTGASVVSNPGVTSVMATECTISHCPPACSDHELPPVSPATKTCENTLTFAQAENFSVTGGIEGSVGWLVADLKASLSASSGSSQGWTGSTTTTSSVLLDCNWQTHRLTMSVIVGKKLCSAATVQGWGTHNCGAGVTTTSGATQYGQVCGTFNIALSATVQNSTPASGDCSNVPAQ